MGGGGGGGGETEDGTIYTSSTAQGRGGSFKKRKTIGRVGC